MTASLRCPAEEIPIIDHPHRLSPTEHCKVFPVWVVNIIQVVDESGIAIYLRMERPLRIETMVSYSTSLKAKRKAAVMALWVTLGAIPKNNKGH